MSDFAIRVQQLGKQYKIGEQEMYRTLRDSIAGFVTSPFRRSRLQPRADNRFWALRDITFDVKHGELVGIIGRNGAGKSTLLKVLSRITEPTKGRAEIQGRVGSLLEVGTGFHPELTGRENIYFNGAILGMRKAEIAHKLDAIIDFAGIDQFVDTPVRRYSSGMYMRLAFAVAAHLETEILLVDEVLAVGDAEFQKKCLGKMHDVSRGGRTVFFVSHSMPAVQRLCNRGILLSRGAIAYDGAVEGAIENYLTTNAGMQYIGAARPGQPTIVAATAEWLDIEREILLRIWIESPFPLRPPIIGFTVFDYSGIPIFGTNTRFECNDNIPAAMDSGLIEVRISTDALRSGNYRISLWLADHYQDYQEVADGLTVTVESATPEAHRPPRVLIGSAQLRTRYSYDTSSRFQPQSAAEAVRG